MLKNITMASYEKKKVASKPSTVNYNDASVVCLVTYKYSNQRIKIDYFIESAPYGLLFTSRKTLETNE